MSPVPAPQPAPPGEPWPLGSSMNPSPDCGAGWREFWADEYPELFWCQYDGQFHPGVAGRGAADGGDTR